MRSRSIFVAGVVMALWFTGTAQASLVVMGSNSYSSTVGGTGDNWGTPPANGVWHWYASLLNDDLVNNGQATLAGVTSSNWQGGNVSYLNNGQLTDNDASYLGQPGIAGYLGYVTTQNSVSSPSIVAYSLNTTLNTLGYDLTEIRTFASWFDSRAGQAYSVEVEYVANPATWVPMGSFSIATPGGQGQSTYLQLGSDQGLGLVFATGVSAVRFSINSGDGTYDGWREIDVVGVATIPEPATGLLLIGALAGLGVLRRRLYGQA